MITIIDNDVILKAGKWCLLGELAGLTDGESSIFHLPTCLYALCPPSNQQKALKRCGDQTTIDRITAFCGSTKPIPRPESSKWLEVLNGIPGIDVGEVQIFSIGIDTPESVNFIGDKRSLLALATAPSALEAFAVLKGRVKCLEQVVAEMVSTYTYVTVAEKIKSRVDADKAISLVFGGPGKLKPMKEIWDGLSSYYSHLYDMTSGLLAPFPTIPSTPAGEPHMEPVVLPIS